MPTPIYFKDEKKDAPLIALRLPTSVYSRVYEEAEREGVTVTEVARGVIRAWASTSPKKPAEKPKPRTRGLDALTDALCEEMAGAMRVSAKDVRKIREELRDYVESTGKKYADYPAALRAWIRRKLDEGKISWADPHKEKRPTAIFRVNGREFASVEAYEKFMAGQDGDKKG